MLNFVSCRALIKSLLQILKPSMSWYEILPLMNSNIPEVVNIRGVEGFHSTWRGLI